MSTLLEAKEVTKIYARAQHPSLNKPSILFADEPTGALDSSSATDLLNTLKDSNEKLGVSSSVEAVTKAIQMGYISPL